MESCLCCSGRSCVNQSDMRIILNSNVHSQSFAILSDYDNENSELMEKYCSHVPQPALVKVETIWQIKYGYGIFINLQ